MSYQDVEAPAEDKSSELAALNDRIRSVEERLGALTRSGDIVSSSTALINT